MCSWAALRRAERAAISALPLAVLADTQLTQSLSWS
jgi:hypothetical protein